MLLDSFLFILFLLALLFLLYPLIKQKMKAVHRQQKYTQILQKIALLYGNHNPFQVALASRPQYPHHLNDLCYGEIAVPTLLDLLATLRPQAHEIFYDLGSGDGKAALAVKLCFPQLTVKAIEIVHALHEIALQNAQTIPVVCICADFLQQDIRDADIIWINATGFSLKTWNVIKQKLNTLKPNTKIILTSKRLPKTQFLKLYEGMECMSWGLTPTRIYQKR